MDQYKQQFLTINSSKKNIKILTKDLNFHWDPLLFLLYDLWRPPPIPFGQVVTRVGRIVNPTKHYGFDNQAPEVTMRDAPPRSPTPDNQPLEGLAGSQWVNVSVWLINEAKCYRQAKVSPQCSDWKKAMDDELKSLKQNDVWNVIPKSVGRKIVVSR